MTNIQDELKKRTEAYTNVDDAQARFKKQKKHIQDIQNFEGMKEIRAFWLAQEKQAIEELTKVNPEKPYELAEIQAKYNLAHKFNEFIKIRLK